MKKISKKILSVFVSLVFLLSTIIPFIRIEVVHAEPEMLRLQFDSTSVSGNVFIFDVSGTNVAATISGSNYTIDGSVVELTADHLNDIKVTLDNNYNSENMKVQFHERTQINVNGDKELVFVYEDFPENSPHIQIVSNGESGNQNEYDDTIIHQGNGVSTLNYTINGVIDYTPGNGYDYGIGFKINGIRYKANDSKVTYTEDTAYERDEHGNLILGDNNQPVPIKDPQTLEPMTEKTSLTITSDTINYDYDTDTNKVNFVFTMAPGTLITELVINGESVNDLPNTAEELMACYTDHALEIPVNNIDKANTYNIEITARYPNSSEEFMGSFLWDYNPQGYTSSEDKILNGRLEFVQAEYNGNVYRTAEEINALGGVYIWNDAPRKKNYTDDREGCGESQFPKGTILTVRIIPDAGYQLVNFGINGGVFEPQETIGTYKFVVEGGPFHLQASIQQVDDVVKTTSEKVSAGLIELGEEESMAVGTAILDVKDIELTQDQIINFKDASTGYDIKSYLDISLFNTVYKGMENQSWDTKITDLENEATIYLQLEDNVNGKEIAIVHEKHDGTYEVIPTEYIAEYNAIAFKTKSFSNYAIAMKTNDAINTNIPNTGDNVMFYILILGLSIIGFTGTGLYLRKKKFN